MDKPRKNPWSRRFGGYAGTVVSQSVFGLIVTYVGLSMLRPEDYGVYAIVSLVISMLAALAVGPVTILSAGKYLEMGEHEKAHANSTFLLLSLGTSLCATAILYLCWPLIDFLTGSPLTSLERALAGLCILPQAVMILYTSLNYNQGFSGRVLAVTLAQGAATLIAMYAGLYTLSLGAASLYLSQLAGFSAAALVSVAQVSRQFRHPSRQWVAHWARAHGSYALNTFVTNLPQFVENAAISRFSNLANLAAWQHSRIYNTFIMRAGKIIGLTIWPVALAEARSNRFNITRQAWRGVYVGFTIIGIGAAFLAKPVVMFLTHSKLEAAAAIVPWWVIYNMLQNSGREAEATLYSADLGVQAANSQSLAKFVSLILLVPLLLMFGLPGAVIAALVEVVCFRWSLRQKARRISDIPMIDGWAFGGSAVIIAATGLEYLLTPMSIEARIIATTIGILTILFLSRSVLFDVFLLYKSAISGKPSVSGDTP